MPVLNPPRAVEAAVDKYLSLSLLDAAGLPVPPTVACESAVSALAAYDHLGPDVVVKPLFGSEGRGLVRVSDRELARRTFHTLERLGAVIYVQATVRHPGFDYRASCSKGVCSEPCGGSPPPASGGRTWPSAGVRRAACCRPRPSAWPSAAGAVGAVHRRESTSSTTSTGGTGRPRGQRRARLEGAGADDGRRRREALLDALRSRCDEHRPLAWHACTDRLRPRGHGAEAGECPPVPRLRRRDLPRLHPQRSGDRPGLRPFRPRGIGATILDAVESTRRVVATNTNLGMILLLAPLAAARGD